MSDSNDTRVDNSELVSKEQASLEQMIELLRNFHHRVAIDGSKDFNALQYLQGISANTSLLGLQPELTTVIDESDTDDHILINCFPNQRIYIFDLFVSLNAAAILSFLDQDGNNAFSPMYAPNDGQGFSFSSQRGLPMKRGMSFIVSSDTAVNYTVTVSYAIIEDVI